MINQTEHAQIFVQLLVGAGLIDRSEFADFKKVARDLNIPVIQAIMNSGSIPKEKLNLVGDALGRVQSKQISPDLAIRALRVAVKKGIGLGEAINEAKDLHKTTRTVVTATNDLTNLLLDAQVLKREHLGPLLVKCHESSIMIGQVMVIEGMVSVTGLLSALNVLTLVREAGLSREIAIKALQQAYQKRITIEQALFEMGKFVRPDARQVKIGELFLMSALISREDYAECLEIELFKQKDFGDTLLERGLVNQEINSAAVHLLEAVAGGIARPYEAARALNLVAKGDTEFRVNDAIHSVLSDREELENFKLGDLIVDAGLCSREALEKTLAASSDSAIKVGSCLIKSHLIDEKYLYSALRLQTALRQGFLSRAGVIEVLRHCYQAKITLDQAFIDLGIFVPSRMQWSWV